MRTMSFVVLLAACGGDDVGNTPDARRAIDAAHDIDAPANACPGGKTIFLNRAGGTFMHAATDNAIANTSLVVDGTQTLAAWPYGDESWQSLKSCIAAGLAPFNATVTDVDPGTALHHEIVFTTKYWGANADFMWAISAANCGGTPATGVSFVFGSVSGVYDHPQEWCEIALSQIGSDLAGLDHARDCHDYLGWFQPACGEKSYVDSLIKCGETEDRACYCGGTAQNSYQRMRNALCH